MNSNLFKDKRVLFAISLAISFILWLIVSMVLRPTGETVVQDVGVNVNVQSGILGQLGLSAIEGAENTVDVTISGSRAVIGGISAEDISVTPSLSGVTGAGVYELELRADNVSPDDFEITGINPEKITVKFDKYVDKTVPVSYNISGDYNIPDEYIQEDVFVDPSEIVVTGPENDIAGIYGAVVNVALSGDYTDTVTVTGDIILVDIDKRPVDYDRDVVQLESKTAKVHIPVHRTSLLPVKFGYTNVPEYFDSESIGFSLSAEAITVEGENSVIEKYSDLFLGYIDLSEITLENPTAVFGIRLPEGLELQSHMDNITVEFDLEGYAESTFKATQINIVNKPMGYSATSNASKVSVTLIGPEDVINGLSAKDIVVEVDLSSREITQTGQYRMRAEIVLPGIENVWAIGDYSVTVTIK